jgi:integrase
MGNLKAGDLNKLPAGRHMDGDGLMLVKGARKASWVLRVQVDGHRVDRGLGSLAQLGLTKAREKAARIRLALKGGEATVAQVKRGAIRSRRSAGSIPTFQKAADATYDALSPGWKHGKHREAWKAALRNHAYKAIGDLLVNDVRPGDVAAALRPIWRSTPETARRTLAAIGQTMTYSHAQGWCEQPLSTAAVRQSLPRQAKRDSHYRALPYADVPAFLSTLRSRFSVGRLALEFVILSACRSGEVRGARWDEIDLDLGIWTVPADRMKGGMIHKVPLSSAMIAVLDKAKLIRRGELVFEGMKRDQQLSDMALIKVLRDADMDVVVHGFRSTFKQWAIELQGDIPNEISEQALAHVVGNTVERAYRRNAQDFDARRRLMEAWGSFGASKAEVPGADRPQTVVPIRKR